MKYLALAAVLAVCVASAVSAEGGCGGRGRQVIRRVGSVVVAPVRAVRSRAKARGC